MTIHLSVCFLPLWLTPLPRLTGMLKCGHDSLYGERLGKLTSSLLWCWCAASVSCGWSVEQYKGTP